MPRLALAAAVLLAAGIGAGCIGYEPGAFSWPRAAFSGVRMTVGCTDLAIDRRADDDDDQSIIVQLEVGNRCDHPVQLDFPGIHVVGTTESGREVKLVPHDPDAELQALPLDGRSYASEAIAYRDPRGETLTGACVDVASLVHAGKPRWVCTREPTAAQVALREAKARTSATGSADPSACDGTVFTDYVGNRECNTMFGTWAAPARLPPMVLDWGMQLRSVDVPTDHGRGLAPAITSDFRYGVGIAHGVYVGLDTELGVAWGAAGELPGHDRTGDALYLGASGFAGWRHALGRFSLSGELAGGVRTVQGNTQAGAATIASDTAGLLEARLRAEVWLSPWASFGLTAGVDTLDPKEQLGGAYFSFHTRAFGGDRR